MWLISFFPSLMSEFKSKYLRNEGRQRYKKSKRTSLGDTERNPSALYVSGVEEGCQEGTDQRLPRDTHVPLCSANVDNRFWWNEFVRARKWPTSLSLNVLGKKNHTETKWPASLSLNILGKKNHTETSRIIRNLYPLLLLKFKPLSSVVWMT